MLRTLFGHRLGTERTAELLDAVRANAEDRRHEYEALLDEMQRAPGTEYARLVVLYGLRTAETIRSWAEEAQRLLPGYEVTIDPRRPHPDTASAMFRIAPVAATAEEG